MNFSIITPTLNESATVEKTMAFVECQGALILEHIVVDGGSTDGTCSKVANTGGKVRMVMQKGSGLYGAMNEGIALCRGDIIGIINAGDTYCPDIVHLVAKEFEDPLIDVVHGDILVFQEDDTDVPIRKIIGSHLFLDSRMSIQHPTVFVRRRCYELYGAFNPQYRVSADYELMLRFVTNGVRFRHIDHVLACFLAGGISSRLSSTRRANNYGIQRKYIGRSHATIRLMLELVITAFYVSRRFIVTLVVGKTVYSKLRKKRHSTRKREFSETPPH